MTISFVGREVVTKEQKMHQLGLWLLLVGLTLIPLSSSYGSTKEYEPLSIEKLRRVAISIDRDYTSTEVTEINRKLVKTSAVESLSNMRVSYAPSIGEKLEILEAHTITSAGKKIPVPASDIKEHQQEIDGSSLELDDRRYKVIVFPSVDLGSEIYVKYKKTRPPFFKNVYTNGFSFSPSLSWARVEISVSYPEDLPIIFSEEGMTESISETKNGVTKKGYVLEAPKASEMESESVSYLDYSPYLNISNLKRHSELGLLYWENAKSKAVPSTELISFTKNLVKNTTDKRQQAEIIYYWVQKNIRYLSDILERGGLIPNDVNQIHRRLLGDCKDHAQILTTMLGIVGIEASPVLINLGNMYKTRKGATFSYNHAITYLADFDIFLDSTSRYSAFGELYESISGKTSIITKTGELKKTPSMTTESNMSQVTSRFVVQSDGRITGNSTYSPNGSYAVNSRSNQNTLSRKSMERRASDYLDSVGESGSGEIDSGHFLDPSKPLVVKSTFILDEQSNLPGFGAMRMPNGIAPDHLATFIKTYALTKRRYPFTCSSRSIKESYEIVFPDTVKLTRIPESVVYKTDHVQYEGNYVRVGNSVKASRVLRLNFPSEVCRAEKNEEIQNLVKVMKRDLREQFFYQ
jgi:hypothetical protein